MLFRLTLPKIVKIDKLPKFPNFLKLLKLTEMVENTKIVKIDCIQGAEAELVTPNLNHYKMCFILSKNLNKIEELFIE